jgi:menaquinone-specific isochorismate synthase
MLDIKKLEAFERGLYAGVVGWLNCRGDGEMVVAIRSALINGSSARLYAGNGIVQGSDPKMEKLETDLKLRALLETIQ